MGGINLNLGWAAPSLTEQLAGLVDEEIAEHFEQDRRAISRLYTRAMIGTGARDSAHRRLISEVRKAVIRKAVRRASNG